MNLSILFKKTVKRTVNFFRRLSKEVPRNLKHKPLGVKKLLSGELNSVEYVELGPAYDAKLELGSAFIKDCSPYLKPVITYRFPPDYIAVITNGRISSYDPSNMAVISGDNYLIEEVSFQWQNDMMAPGWNNAVFWQQGFTEPKKYRGKVFSMLAGGGAIHYYYHWMFDAIPKLFLLKKSGLFDEVDYFLVPNYGYPYHKEFLNQFGITADKIIDGNVEHHVEADYLIVSSYVRWEDHHPKWVCDFLRDTYVIPGHKSERKKRIYIGRGDASRNRKITNEADLMELLRGYGFETYLLSEISLHEKAQLFNSAEVVVSAHGAGLSNLVFCGAGTKVLEIFPDNYVRHAYYDLANKCGLEYHYLLCPSTGIAKNSFDGQRIGLTADIAAIGNKVTSILGISASVATN